MDYLKQVHQREYQILEYIDKFCEDNNIKYFLIVGSLLGAARHDGFIPWNDDIDLGMLREDYEIFLQLWKDTRKYILLEGQLQKDYTLAFAKISDLNSKVVLDYHNDDFHLGLSIDVFPFDYVDDDYGVALKERNKFLFWYTVSLSKRIKDIIKDRARFESKIQKLVGYLINKFLGANRVKRILRKTMVHDETNTVANLATGYEFKKEVYPLDFTQNLIRHKFEQGSFPIFSQYKKALEIQYGPKWMEIPDPSTIRGGNHDILELSILMAMKLYLKQRESNRCKENLELVYYLQP